MVSKYFCNVTALRQAYVTQEALLGRPDFPTNGHGPQAEQERRIGISEVPQSFSDFLFLLADQLPYAWTHPGAALVDGALGINERLKLRLNPLQKNPDVPRGDGSGVEVLPGFFGSKASSKLITDNLSGINYRAGVVPLRYYIHLEPTEKMPDGIISHLKKRKKETGGKVHLITHSKGVHAALYAAITRPEEFSEYVDQLFLVAGDIPVRVNTAVGLTYAGTQLIFRGNDFRLGKILNGQEGLKCLDSVRLTTIKVKRDPIMSGYSFGDHDELFEVEGSHTAAVENNLPFIAQRLARPHIPLVRGDGKLLHFPQKKAA